jgi:DNA-directed RNA polymerase II subunit RPB1
VRPEIAKDLNEVRDILNSIETTYIRDIVKSARIYFSPSDLNTDIEDDRTFIQLYKTFGEIDETCDRTSSPWLLRFEFNKSKMFDLGLTMDDINHTLYNFYEDSINCLYSDDNADKLVFRIRLADTTIDDVITELKALEQNILDNVIVKGVKHINKAMISKVDTMTYNDTTQQYEKSYEWVISTDGTNFLEIMANPKVDAQRLTSNDVHEVMAHLGIEASRQCLINEIQECLESVGVNFRHIALLADVMTSRGALLSIDRHGVNRSDIGPLAKCSFEETSDMLIKAGMFAEFDPVNGVSANIMLGQIPPCGTGDTTIVVDEAKLLEIMSQRPAPQPTTTLTDEEIGQCTLDNLAFDFDGLSMGTAVGVIPKQTDIMLNIM